ncbi:MAG: carbohydrate porin [Ignavibacteriaceae bacterium]|nr:carbohydrate porin [Ignavibacteriaceae bacterium]
MNKLAGADGLSLNLSGLGIQGGTFMQNTGAMQGISNIAGVNHWKLYEAWIEQNFLNEDLSILIGLYDLNSEFDVRESSGIFINPSFGIGFDFAQSGENGPSIFPYASLALRINYNLSESFKILTAVFDGVPGSLDDEKGFQVQWNKDEGAMLSTELIFFPSTREFGQNYSKYLIGLWYFIHLILKIYQTTKMKKVILESMLAVNNLFTLRTYHRRKDLLYSEDSE